MVFVRAWTLGVLASGLAAAASGRADARDMTYARDVKPLLDAHCIECHHDGGRKPDLSQFPFRMGEEEADQDAIVQKVLTLSGGTTPRMPPGMRPKLTSSEVDVIRQWREQGLLP